MCRPRSGTGSGRLREFLGYRVNRLAQTLKGEQSHLVGIVGSNLSSPFAAQQLDQLSLGLLRRGMQCLLLNAADADEDVSPLIELILEFRVRAIVVMSGAPPSAIFDECLANGVRVILVNREVDVEADTVRSDDFGGVKLAAERLLRAGCRRPAVVCGAATQSQTRRRNEFLKVMFDADLEPAIWSQGQTSYETGGHAAREAHSIPRDRRRFLRHGFAGTGFPRCGEVVRRPRARRCFGRWI